MDNTTAFESNEVRFEGIHCTFVIERPAKGIAVMRIAGRDVGEFGDAPIRELSKDLADGGRLDLFVDARNVQGASIDVSNDWALWLRSKRPQLERVSMLTGSHFIQITADFVRRFAELENLMQVYSDPVAFDAALMKAVSESANHPS